MAIYDDPTAALRNLDRLHAGTAGGRLFNSPHAALGVFDKGSGGKTVGLGDIGGCSEPDGTVTDCSRYQRLQCTAGGCDGARCVCYGGRRHMWCIGCPDTTTPGTLTDDNDVKRIDGP